VTSPDPRERMLRTLKGQLRGGPRVRRRVLREIAAHFDDLVAELRAAGVSDATAVQEALRRLGDPEAIATAFAEPRSGPGRRSRVRSLRSPAWIAVAAMSAVTAWAAELPQASGAKATTRAASALHTRHLGRSTVAGRARRHRPRS
jgi:hypothetical protein